MMKRFRLFDNSSAIQSFFILFFGFLILLISGLYVINVFLDMRYLPVTPKRLTTEVIRTVRLVKLLPANSLPQHVKQLHTRGLRITIGSKPLANAHVLQTAPPSVLRTAVRNNPRALKLSVSLSNGRWLNMQRQIVQHPWFSVGFFVSCFVLLIALGLLCYLVVKRLAIPLSEFSSAAKRFGMDVQSPPMAVAGSTEIQEVVQAFNDMQNRIRRLLHDRTQMLAAVSHDLRTPITRLQLRAEYLKGTPQYEKAVTDLKDMDKMISSILSFARDHAQTETMERFDLNVLLESLCNDMVDMGRQASFSDDGERLTYFGRMPSLKRAFTNFIDNAIKYGKVADVSLHRTGNEIHIKIKDKGPGIPEDQLDKVFDPFYRIDSARSPQISGTGLGMTVARDIIRTHGGDVTLMNHKAGGLIVFITLPFTEQSTCQKTVG